ncbi:MAG TPA: HAMP domain-containing sensor histidine kinase [Planctomycetota bacterium]|nr:HAMP domain-containing sensor histidine kinase [Planctomycetota bacterium]
MNSIFVRSSRLATIAVLAAYTVVAGAVYAGIGRHLEQRADDALISKASVMATLIHRDGQRLEFEFDSALMPEFSRKRFPEYFELRLNDGSVYARSDSLGERALEDLARAPIASRSAWGIELPGERHGRAVALQVRPQLEIDGDLVGEAPDPPLRLTLAQGGEELDSVLDALRTGLLLGGVVLALLVVISIRWSLARGLAPLTELARKVDAVTPETLDVEFSSRDDVPELAGIRSRLDELISRLGSALERERRFTSAAAHELRTPLAELKTLSQVAERWPEEHELRARLPADVLALCARMQHTVESLLTFARAARAETPRPVQPVDLSLHLTRLLEQARPRAAAREQELAVDVQPGLRFSGDATLVESVLRNLLDNALAHGPKQSAVTVRARKEHDRLVVELENGRGEIEERDLPHLFEPFWRKDPARHGEAHAGLGLALVEAWVRSWDGTITAEIVLEETLRFTLRLPAA